MPPLKTPYWKPDLQHNLTVPRLARKVYHSWDPDTIVIVGGDFNCYLGRRCGGVTHRHVVHKTPNLRGSKLVEKMASLDYVAASTFFAQGHGSVRRQGFQEACAGHGRLQYEQARSQLSLAVARYV